MSSLRKTSGDFWSSDEFDMAEYGGSIIDIVPSRDADYYIFASTHRSERGSQSFTAHTPGNWGEAGMGGAPKTLNIAYGSKIAAAARKMAELSKKSLGWGVSIEADHHGPTLNRPVLFVEIGSTENEWKNPEAGRIAAEGILSAIRQSDAPFVLAGFGGNHYCSKFGPKAISGECVFGHIIPGYSLERDGIENGMVLQAIQKNVESVEAAAIAWKGLKGELRSRLISMLEENGIKWVRM
jgi:D-aminoacyl-tRNA deacylase